MTPEQTFILALVTAVVTSILAPLVKAWVDRNKTMAEYGNEIAAGGVAAVNAMEKVLDKYEKKIADLESEIALLTQRQTERTKEMEDLQVRIQADLMETNHLKHEVEKLRAQVAEGDKKYDELKGKHERVVESFGSYLKARGETLPPDLALLLGDSNKFKGVGK